MTTDAATRYLGEVLEFGGGNSRADHYLNGAIAQAKKTNWATCGQLLATAYRALGAEPPVLDDDPYYIFYGRNPGYLFYAGEHPIQRAAVEAGREMDEWLDSPPPSPVATKRRNPRRTPRISAVQEQEFQAILTSTESSDATIEMLDEARHALASRADRMARDPRHRQAVVDLRAQYDRILGRLLAMGWN